MSETLTRVHRFDSLETALTNASSRVESFSSPDFTAELTERLDGLLEGEKILSLDVFDTLILRDNSSEITRFYEIGGKMAEIASDQANRPVSQVDAFTARHLGTKATYRASDKKDGCREGSLIELHRTASRLLTGNAALTESFITAELDYEVARIVPNPYFTEYMARHRKKGGRVALVTDTYMHETHVARLLEKLGIRDDQYDFLISSADTKVSKASGGIFALVEQAMQASPEDFVHLGDSFRGDVARPIRCGWQALHLPISQSDLLARRQDHVDTARMLEEKYGLSIDIAMPH